MIRIWSGCHKQCDTLELDDGPGGAVLSGSKGPLLLRGPGRGRVLGLRPEDIAVDSTGAHKRLHVLVTALEYLGADALVTCRAGDRPIVARVRGALVPPVGAEVSLTWDAAAAHVFDAANGRRVANGGGSTSPAVHLENQTGRICA